MRSYALTLDLAVSLKISKEHTTITKAGVCIQPKPMTFIAFGDITAEKVILPLKILYIYSDTNAPLDNT
jgi:hypothetical protein